MIWKRAMQTMKPRPNATPKKRPVKKPILVFLSECDPNWLVVHPLSFLARLDMGFQWRRPLKRFFIGSDISSNRLKASNKVCGFVHHNSFRVGEWEKRESDRVTDFFFFFLIRKFVKSRESKDDLGILLTYAQFISLFIYLFFPPSFFILIVVSLDLIFFFGHSLHHHNQEIKIFILIFGIKIFRRTESK